MGINADNIAGVAANIRAGENPPFTVEYFLSLYPNFSEVPTEVIQIYIDLAQNSIMEGRFRSSWKLVIGWFVAHFCTLWLRDRESGGEVVGITTSESVDGVSYTTDTTAIMQDLNGFAAWKTTSYGIQLATLAKLYGKGGMVVR